jgi:uncharacterized protein YxjI
MRKRRIERGQESQSNRYQMRQKLVSLGDDFWIDNERGERVFKVDGKAVRVRDTLIFRDAQGNQLCKVQERMLRVKDSMEIEGPNGEQLGMVKKALITPLRERWTVKIGIGPDLDVQGNILDHEYSITAGRGNPVAQISKKWFRMRDTYGVEISPAQNDLVILAVTVAIDNMTHANR